MPGSVSAVRVPRGRPGAAAPVLVTGLVSLAAGLIGLAAGGTSALAGEAAGERAPAPVPGAQPLPAATPLPTPAAIPLPGGEEGIGFDDLRFDPALHRIVVPGGATANLAPVDPVPLAGR